MLVMEGGGFELENVALFSRLPGDLSLSVTHTHSLSLSHTHTHTKSHIHTLSLSLSHTHTRAHTHTDTHTHTLAHALTAFKVVSHFNFVVVAVVSNKKGCLCTLVGFFVPPIYLHAK